MRLRHPAIILLTALSIVIGTVVADTSEPEFDVDAITGRWVTDRDSIVLIEKARDQYFGVVIAVGQPTAEQREEIDREDPENFGKLQPEFDTQALVGVQILHSIEYRDKGVWKGKYYDDLRHKNFNAKLTLENENTLQVRANAFVEEKKTASWTRLRNE
jgi:uncharacterized protein (DUF2147 family)